ncbi:MAG: CbtA family protein [Pseudomonadales bacterium]|jgi:cobalt transporter subunit CbtA|nr:CbtA family protein [Pseudomonadales bacterium]
MKTWITPALLAGFLAAVILTVAQMFTAVPLILEAETYEQATESAPVPAPSHDAAAADHHHSDAAAEEEWEPENGWQRTLSTASANVVMGVGYALILMGLFRFRTPKNVLTGLAWGAAGYLSVFVAPSLGLHPELPGTAAAELVGRQEWWIGTVLATAAGLSLCALTRSWSLRAIGFVLIALPHLIGAPLPAVKEALAPEALQHQFILTSALLNALFWLVLGAASAWFYIRANRSAVEGDQPSTTAAMSAAN